MEEDAEDAEKEYDVLIRCTDGLEINFATRVSPRIHHVPPRLVASNPRIPGGRCRSFQPRPV